ncbi:MAG: cupredoxin domain-containing protein [Nanoarchaeota archaeon]|nr:cupredoxin domain-containing protein [Nanoarchaeota archaeon]
MKNPLLILFIVIVALGAAGAYLYNAGSSDKPNGNSTTGNAIIDGEVQKITLSLKNYNYYPNTITVKANQPVSLTLDSSVGGCYRDFVIKGLGVKKYSKNPGDTIDFTPTKKGTFTFACSMSMGTGKIVVE